MENYSCSLCGKTNVKLWRPYGHASPLICAECAEKRYQISTLLVPAIKDEEGNFYFSEDVPVDKKEGWRKLPTRLEDN